MRGQTIVLSKGCNLFFYRKRKKKKSNKLLSCKRGETDEAEKEGRPVHSKKNLNKKTNKTKQKIHNIIEKLN